MRRCTISKGASPHNRKQCGFHKAQYALESRAGCLEKPWGRGSRYVVSVSAVPSVCLVSPSYKVQLMSRPHSSKIWGSAFLSVCDSWCPATTVTMRRARWWSAVGQSRPEMNRYLRRRLIVLLLNCQVTRLWSSVEADKASSPANQCRLRLSVLDPSTCQLRIGGLS